MADFFWMLLHIKSLEKSVSLNNHFLTYGEGRVALYGIIGALIMLICNSHEQLRTGGIHHVYVGHLHSYLKLGAFAESDVAHSLYEKK